MAGQWINFVLGYQHEFKRSVATCNNLSPSTISILNSRLVSSSPQQSTKNNGPYHVLITYFYLFFWYLITYLNEHDYQSVQQDNGLGGHNYILCKIWSRYGLETQTLLEKTNKPSSDLGPLPTTDFS